jgi:hypothetical protein
VASTVVAEDNSDDSVSKFFESEDSGSSIVWTEGSSDEDLDYFAALDVAAAETSLRLTGEDIPCASAGRRRRRAVAKRRVSELSRSDRRHGEVEGSRLRVDGTAKRELLSSPTVGEGELRNLFEGEKLRIMLFNYREMGIIPKVEPL